MFQSAASALRYLLLWGGKGPQHTHTHTHTHWSRSGGLKSSGPGKQIPKKRSRVAFFLSGQAQVRVSSRWSPSWTWVRVCVARWNSRRRGYRHVQCKWQRGHTYVLSMWWELIWRCIQTVAATDETQPEPWLKRIPLWILKADCKVMRTRWRSDPGADSGHGNSSELFFSFSFLFFFTEAAAVKYWTGRECSLTPPLSKC